MERCVPLADQYPTRCFCVMCSAGIIVMINALARFVHFNLSMAEEARLTAFGVFVALMAASRKHCV